MLKAKQWFGRRAARLAGMVVWLVMIGTVTAMAASAGGNAPGAAARTSAAARTGSGGAIDTLIMHGTLPTPKALFMFSPWINGIILALSVIALMMFLFLMVTITRRSMVPPDFVEEVTKLAIRGRYDEAGDLCRRHHGVFVASIIKRCVENAGKGHSVIMDMIDSEGRRRADIVWNRISYLSDISNVAPMLGLLGTVVGMMKAFFGLNLQTANVSSGTLAAGVGEAMSTTMFGLTVGIVALIFYSIVKARVTRTLADAEQAVHSVADHIKRGES